MSSKMDHRVEQMLYHIDLADFARVLADEVGVEIKEAPTDVATKPPRPAGSWTVDDLLASGCQIERALFGENDDYYVLCLLGQYECRGHTLPWGLLERKDQDSFLFVTKNPMHLGPYNKEFTRLSSGPNIPDLKGLDVGLFYREQKIEKPTT